MLMVVSLVMISLGGLVSVIASVIMLVAGFMTHVGWGLAMFFLPGIPQLVFLFTHWERARLAFQISLLGFLLTLGGGIMGYHTLSRIDHSEIERMARERLPGMVDRFGASMGWTIETNAMANSNTTLAGKPAAEELDMVGKHINEIIERLGYPSARLETGDLIVLQYDRVEVEAGRDQIIRRQTLRTPRR